MKQWLLFPRQKVGLVWVSAIFRTQILLHSFLLFTFLLSPIAASAVDITQLGFSIEEKSKIGRIRTEELFNC
ncbi:hypothetical protein [Nostoc sp.]|uniref:hypothetical protein n=1 Tax=Nostoc sp. TaxID=1180 RepID=UPI002FF87F9B